MKFMAAVFVCVFSSFACAPQMQPPPTCNTYSQALKPARPLSEGSLWRDSSRYEYLFSDLRARSVGDVVTVQIVERAEALKSATTKTSRDSSLGASITSMFGTPWSSFLGNLYGSGNPFKPEIKGSFLNEFEGTGVTQRKDTLVATITAKVVEVLPGGLLRIEGYKDLTINNERNYILLRGVIRPEDISPYNTVSSNVVADMQIIYTGSGVISDKQRPGWLSRILDRVWPF